MSLYALGFFLSLQSQLSVPADFIPLTEVAKQLSAASGEKYRLSPELEREVVYFSTKDKSVEHVREVIAKAYYSKWDQTSSGYVLKLDQKLRKQRETQEFIDWQRKVKAPKLASPSTTSYVSQVLKEYNLKKDQLATINRVTTEESALDQLLKKALAQIPSAEIIGRKPGEQRHFSSVPHPYATAINLNEWQKEYARNDERFRLRIEELPPRLLYSLNINSVNLVANSPIQFWITINDVSAEITLFNAAGERTLAKSLNFAAPGEVQPGWSDAIEKDWVYEDLPEQLPVMESEPAELIFGRIADRVAKQNQDTVIILPDSETIVRRRKGETFRADQLNRKLKIESKESQIFIRPVHFDRCLQTRANRISLRAVLNEFLKEGYVSYDSIRDYLKNQPNGNEFYNFIFNFRNECGQGSNDALGFMFSSEFRLGFSVFDSLDGEQRKSILNRQSLPVRFLSSETKLLIAKVIRDNPLPSTQEAGPGQPRRLYPAPLPFTENLQLSTSLEGISKDELFCLQRSKTLKVTQTNEPSDLGYLLFQQEKGRLGWEDGYLPVKESTFRPITCQRLTLKLSQGRASNFSDFRFFYNPGKEVSSLSELPESYQKEIKQAYDHYSKIGR